MEKASGDALNRWAALMGIKRRWFGLEPDFMLRKRMMRGGNGVRLYENPSSLRQKKAEA